MKRIFLNILRFSFFGLVALATLGVLFLSLGNYFGKRAWERYRREAEAQGARFDLMARVPSPVPDEQNAAMTPLWKEVFSSNGAALVANRLKLKEYPKNFTGRWKGQKMDFGHLGGTDLLAPFQSCDAELAEISEAFLRPFCRFPVHYEDGFAASFPHINVLIQLQRLYGIRALVYLQRGQVDQAFADEQTQARLTDSVKDEPLLISQLVRGTLFAMNSQVIWEGLADHRWSEAQLVTMQRQLSQLDLLKALRVALENERAQAVDYWPKIIRDPRVFTQVVQMSDSPVNQSLERDFSSLLMKGYPYFLRMRSNQAILFYSQFFDTYLLAGVDPAAHRVYPEKMSQAEKAIPYDFLPLLFPEHLLSRLTLPALSPSFAKFAQMQATVDEAFIACALERYRLAQGEYPETLDALIPHYVARLPHDVMNGQPLHYRRTPEGSFLLYSVGWDGKDDGGVPAPGEGGRPDIKHGDWAWFYPALNS